VCKDVLREKVQRRSYHKVLIHRFNILKVTRISRTVFYGESIHFTRNSLEGRTSLGWEYPEFVDRRNVDIDHWTRRRVVHTHFRDSGRALPKRGNENISDM